MKDRSAPARPRAGYIVLIAAILAVPRIARLAFPQIWIEDESYLNTAFMVSRGWMPYRDFPLPHLPLLEIGMAGVFRVAPIAIRTGEIVSASAALAGSLLVYGIGERIGGRAAATVAALIFATNSLLFRYHIFEREVFDVVLVLAAVWITLAGPKGLTAPGPKGRALQVGVLFAVAMAIKLTALAALVAVVLQITIEKRRRDAAVVAVTAIGLVAGLSIILATMSGMDFIVQVFAFRAVHATFPSLGVKVNEMRYTLDVAFATGAAGVVFIVWTGRARQWLAPLLQLASGLVFLVLLNPTYWAHTGIELLPWLALCGGGLAVEVARPVSRRVKADRYGRPIRLKTDRQGRSRDDRVPAWVCASGAVLLVLYVSPIRNLNWEAGDGSVYGFGYRDRLEIANVAMFVRDHTAKDARVATPPIIAFAANRLEQVPYAELAGSVADLADAVRREGLMSAITGSPLRTQTFWEAVDASRERIAPVIDEAVAKRRVGAVINYSSNDMMPVPLIDVSQPALQAAGYDLASITPHYEIWIARR